MPAGQYVCRRAVPHRRLREETVGDEWLTVAVDAIGDWTDLHSRHSSRCKLVRFDAEFRPQGHFTRAIAGGSSAGFFCARPCFCVLIG